MFTPQQKNAYDFIKSRIEESGGVSPSFDEIAAHLKIKSKSGVHRIVEALIAKGQIVKVPNRKRALAIKQQQVNATVSVTCPHCQQELSVSLAH